MSPEQNEGAAMMAGQEAIHKHCGHAINEMARVVHANAVAHGWWEEPRSDAECLALIHSEVSEALEAARKGYPQSEKIPEHGNFVEELADCVIRVMDLCACRGVDLGAAVVAKHAYNVGRPYKHGKAF